MASDEDLAPKEQARIRSRERKSRPPRMVIDNAGVRRIQLALKARARQEQSASKPTTQPAKSRRKDRPVK